MFLGLIKALIYRVLGTLITVAGTYYFTGSIKTALSVGAIDTVFKILLFWGYDSLWSTLTSEKRKPSIVWLTGLSGSGKTTLAKALQQKLLKKKHQVLLLDGDEIRTLFPGTGFDEQSRKQHILKVGQMAAYLQTQGITTIVSLISPYRSVRDEIRATAKNFIEVYVATPLEECERRDTKGLYAKARAGEIKQFTGIDAPYEEPLNPEIKLDTTNIAINDCVRILSAFKKD